MAKQTYISTKEAVRLTGLSTQEIYDLIHSGKLPAHKAPKSGWRISPQGLADLGLIHEEAESVEEVSQTEDSFSYVADEEHYTEVFRRMTEVKRSLKIATGDLKNFNVTIERDGGEEKLRLCDFFLSLVERGVQVQVVWGDKMMQAPLSHFERAWDDPDILKHTWKRFATKAKEFLRKD